MALTFKEIGKNPDGSPHYEITSDSENPVIVFTGPHTSGVVTLPDGAEYDLTPPYIEVASLEHGHLVSHLNGIQREQHGVGPEPVDVPFVHTCTDDCGELKREEC